jgi:hypothetical protein
MLTNDESDGIPEPIYDEDDALIGHDITYVLETMRAHDARPDDGRCVDCKETIVKGCSVFVYGDRLCMECGSDRKVRT